MEIMNLKQKKTNLGGKFNQMPGGEIRITLDLRLTPKLLLHMVEAMVEVMVEVMVEATAEVMVEATAEMIVEVTVEAMAEMMVEETVEVMAEMMVEETVEATAEVEVVTLTQEEEVVDTAGVDDTITWNFPVAMVAEEDEWAVAGIILVFPQIIMALGLNHHSIPINLGMDLVFTKKDMIPLVINRRSIINLLLPVGTLSYIVPTRRSEVRHLLQKKGKK
jgi:hypothetical protein